MFFSMGTESISFAAHVSLLDCCKQLVQMEWVSTAASQKRTLIPFCLVLNSPLHFQLRMISFNHYCRDSVGAATSVLGRKQDQPQAFVLVSEVHDPAENLAPEHAEETRLWSWSLWLSQFRVCCLLAEKEQQGMQATANTSHMYKCESA